MLMLVLIVVILVSASGFGFFWQKKKVAAAASLEETGPQLVAIDGGALAAALSAGDTLDLAVEPGDPDAVRVASRLGQLGYLPKREAPQVHQLVSFGAVKRGRVDAVEGQRVLFEPLVE